MIVFQDHLYHFVFFFFAFGSAWSINVSMTSSVSTMTMSLLLSSMRLSDLFLLYDFSRRPQYFLDDILLLLSVYSNFLIRLVNGFFEQIVGVRAGL